MTDKQTVTTTDSFNFICADCGPAEGESYRFLGDQNLYCEQCFKEREKEIADDN